MNQFCERDDAKAIYITSYDMTRLENLLEGLGASARSDRQCHPLEGELLRAREVAPENIPPDVITMNSQIRLRDLDTNQEITCTLVFPSDADIGTHKISILAPVGTALIGYRVGDDIRWEVPAGHKNLRVLSIIYQPEAAGDYQL